jgi:sphingomyelin phosphodiesterase
MERFLCWILGLIFLTDLPVVIAHATPIIQLSDIHLDLHYRPGAPADCLIGHATGLGCCRWYNIPRKPFRSAGAWGDYGCDAPLQLAEFALQWVNKSFPNPGVLLWTGDTASHHDITQSFKQNMENVDVVTALIRKYLPSWKIFPVIGNHDTWPVDQLPLPDPYTSVTVHLANSWKGWIPEDQVENFKRGGFYRGTWNCITVLVLNCLYQDNNNILGRSQTDPAGQLAWLASELHLASTKGEKVWIINHIPPGGGESSAFMTATLYNLTRAYSDTIVGQFYGHTHADQFTLYYAEDGVTPVGMTYIAPSLLPSNHLPAMTLFDHDGDTITDKRVFYVNMTELNKEHSATFVQLYSAKESYGLPDLSAKSWNDLYIRMTQNATLAGMYAQFQRPGGEQTYTPSMSQDAVCNTVRIGGFRHPGPC